ANQPDIFEGSHVIEKLTAEIIGNARVIAIRLREAGYARAIALVSAELTRLLAERQRKLEVGEIIQVGVNAFKGEIGLLPEARSASAVADFSTPYPGADEVPG